MLSVVFWAYYDHNFQSHPYPQGHFEFALTLIFDLIPSKCYGYLGSSIKEICKDLTRCGKKLRSRQMFSEVIWGCCDFDPILLKCNGFTKRRFCEDLIKLRRKIFRSRLQTSVLQVHLNLLWPWPSTSYPKMA